MMNIILNRNDEQRVHTFHPCEQGTALDAMSFWRDNIRLVQGYAIGDRTITDVALWQDVMLADYTADCIEAAEQAAFKMGVQFKPIEPRYESKRQPKNDE